MASRFHENPVDPDHLLRLDDIVGLLEKLPFQVNLWKVQNVCYEILKTTLPEMVVKAEKGDKVSEKWVRRFTLLAENLSKRVD